MKDLNNKIATFIVATSLLPISSYAAFTPITVDGTTYYDDNYTPSFNSQRILNDISNQEQAEAQERIQKDLKTLEDGSVIIGTPKYMGPVDTVITPKYMGPVDTIVTPKYMGPVDTIVTPKYMGPVDTVITPKYMGPVDTIVTPKYMGPVDTVITPKYMGPVDTMPVVKYAGPTMMNNF